MLGSILVAFPATPLLIATNLLTALLVLSWLRCRRSLREGDEDRCEASEECAATATASCGCGHEQLESDNVELFTSDVVESDQFSDFDEVDKALVREVATGGSVKSENKGVWLDRAEKISSEFGRRVTPSQISERWETIAPRVYAAVRANNVTKDKSGRKRHIEMPCGNTCSACPSQSTCSFHDSDGGLVELEELCNVGSKPKRQKSKGRA
eukprot:jgi/Bigna1/85331/estExt_fgenesh1_pg.C_30270